MEKIIYKNDKDEQVEFSNMKPYILTNIEGTGGVDTEIYTSNSPNQDGTSYHGNALSPRVLIIEGGIVGINKEDMFNKRAELSRVFSPKGTGILTYINDAKEYHIECIVEQAPVWGEKVRKLQEFMLQLYCPIPFWLDELIKEEIALWRGAFEFPLEILSDGIEMGYRESNLIINVFNKGDVPCGMKIEFIALATVENPSLFDVNTREFIKINQTLIAGDVLTIETTFANKRIELNRGGEVSNIFNFIDLDSDFLQLSVGDNVLRYDAETGIDNLEASIYYKPNYLGV